MKQLVYNKTTGRLIGLLPESQDPSTFYVHYKKAFIQELGALLVEDSFLERGKKLIDFKVVDNIVVERPENEKEEMLVYRKILTEEERLIETLKPSGEEIKKAEMTIEILTIFEEVL
ncbi:hypothetical protein [Alkaliphilus sp. B6464]|uniref:hypothetical protein n=1 Tax=Alkaliphilus sp. B6464 TaxID=2731219 RepID=UPI001BAD7207|nr:hypothetical protein [Alkaliphilus sp. B6464]QUH21070.1 hypothetical protein HYG84_15080 [Alkaliphilus sp. B6464]